MPIFKNFNSFLIIITMIFDQVSPNSSPSQSEIVGDLINKSIMDKICNEYDQKINVDIKKKRINKFLSKLINKNNIKKLDTGDYDKHAPGISQ